jgi:voltage-gated potassium channel
VDAIGFLGDVAIWLVFTAELVSMLMVVPNRWKYLRTHPLDVAIVVLTPPVAPAILQSIRLLRVLRVLRLFLIRSSPSRVSRMRASLRS